MGLKAGRRLFAPCTLYNTTFEKLIFSQILRLRWPLHFGFSPLALFLFGRIRIG
jgi:hypothetical protein